MIYCNVNNVEFNIFIFGIVELCKQFCDFDRVLVVRIFVIRSIENKVFVCFMNFYNEVIYLRKDIFIVELNLVFEVMVLFEKGSDDFIMLELFVYL